MTTSWTAALEAELHGLVDGQIETGRRADALRRLASSPANRAQVEAWQGQNDLLRNAFAGVERERVPPMLDMRARPQLHCIPANDAPLVAPPEADPRPRRNVLGSLAAILVAATGLAGSWVLLNQSEPSPPPATIELRGPIDADLMRRSMTALGPSAAVSDTKNELPTARIPDLGAQGFRFVGAETERTENARSIQFRYRSPTGERLVLGVARAGKAEASRPTPVAGALRWRSGDKVYALASTLETDRLRPIAAALQAKLRQP